MLYRIAKDEETAERIAAKIYNGEIDERGFRKLTRSLYPDVAAVYGWKIAGQKCGLEVATQECFILIFN